MTEIKKESSTIPRVYCMQCGNPISGGQRTFMCTSCGKSFNSESTKKKSFIKLSDANKMKIVSLNSIFSWCMQCDQWNPPGIERCEKCDFLSQVNLINP